MLSLIRVWAIILSCDKKAWLWFAGQSLDTVTLTSCWKKSDAICPLQPTLSFQKPHASKVKVPSFPSPRRCICQYQWQAFQRGSNKTKLFRKPFFFFSQHMAFCWSLTLERKKTKQNTHTQGRYMSTYFRLSQPSSALQAISQVNVCLQKSSRRWALLCFGLAASWATPLRPFLAASFTFSSLKVPCRTVLMISPAPCSSGSSHLPLGGWWECFIAGSSLWEIDPSCLERLLHHLQWGGAIRGEVSWGLDEISWFKLTSVSLLLLQSSHPRYRQRCESVCRPPCWREPFAGKHTNLG